MEIRWIGRVVNLVAHSLARYAKNVSNFVIRIEDFPPLALEALYLDSIQFQELMNEIFFLKKKTAYPAKSIRELEGMLSHFLLQLQLYFLLTLSK